MNRIAIITGMLVLCGVALLGLGACGIAHAKKEQNTGTDMINNVNPQAIKELIARMKGELEVDTDRLPDLIRELETTLANTPEGTANRAILHSMTAEMYNRYLQQNRWQIRGRTAISGYVPDDMREWSANLFDEQVEKHLDLSLQPAKLLQQTPVSLYDSILTKGESTVELRPTLYDFLAQRAVTLKPAEERYNEWLAFRRGDTNRKATLMVELDRLSYIFRHNPSGKSAEEYRNSLDDLIKQYGQYDFSNEIRIAQSELPAYGITNRDSIKTIQYNILQEGIRLYPDYPRTNVLRNKLADMENPFLRSQIPQTVYPGQEAKLQIEYNNLKEITLRIYESVRTPIEITPYNNSDKPKDKKGKLVREITYRLDSPDTYRERDTTLTAPGTDPGLYEYVVSTPDGKLRNEHIVSVSRLAAVFREVGGRQEILVTDHESGKPIEGATVTYYGGKRRELRMLGETKTGKDGTVFLPAEKTKDILSFQATTAEDTAGRFTLLYPEYGADPIGSHQSDTQISLFTDRGLYRPGQSLYFKGIVYQLAADRPKVIANRSYTVILRDANNKEIATRQLRTNEFGSFNGEFVLPKQGLTGSFTLSVNDFSTFFRVEEYKRPTFTVKIDPIREEIAFGDQVNIKGTAKTFSGVALHDGTVEWRIVRRPNLMRILYGAMGERQVASGTTALTTDGSFTVSFQPEKESEANLFFQSYNYELVATVTDSKGEAQEAQFTFPVGDASLSLTIEGLPAQVEKSNLRPIVSARLLNGEPATAKGTYRILSMKSENAEEGTPYKEDSEVASGTFTSGSPLPADVFRRLPSGMYRIRLEAKDSKGRKVETEHDFVLYGKEDNRPPVFSREWLITGKTACLPGEDAEWTFGTSFDNAYVLYEVFHNNRLIKRERIVLNNETRTFRLPFKEEYGDGVMASFTYIKKGSLYVTSVPVTRRLPDRKLTIRPETFRDRLLPGTNETWKFRITDADSLAVSAEVLASLYDLSLDKIVPFNWYFSPERSIYLQAPQFLMSDNFGRTYESAWAEKKSFKESRYTFDNLDWQGIWTATQKQMRLPRIAGETEMSTRASGGIMQEEAAADNVVFYSLSEPTVTGAVAQMKTVAQDDAATGPGSTNIPTPLRTNFNETAFFFPTLQTNKEGDVVISFTLPESTTTWKLQMVAHTKELKYGVATQEAVSSKPLMVVPNLPRYLRQGDRIAISTQVLSQSEEAITGNVRLEWFDPATEQIITSLKGETKEFKLAAGAQTSVSWKVEVPAGRELIGCRIVADADAGSDGEQHVLPVLSNLILVTESTPFYLTDNKEQRIEINRQPNSRAFRLTLEMSANPVWYAVQALPTLTTPTNDNILSWFASYYANTLATSIAASHPRIQRVITQWTAQGGNAETLLSNLEKNEELKNILLEETPWVMEARNETERKQRLALLFDMNRANGERETAMRRLIDQQTEDGGWGWFKGFYPNRSMTLSILKGMTKLIQLGAVQYSSEEKEMQMRALRYLDRSMQKDYESLKKWNKEWDKVTPSAEQVEFLYVRSGYRDIPEAGEAREAIRFYTNQAEKNWEQLSLYGKAQVALLMHRNGKKEVAAEIMVWLRRTATTSAELGMYWANNRKGIDFFTSPIDVHTLLMFAFHEISPDKTETDRMKQWLLNQKRTQDWESVPATLNAIHAILLTGSDWLNEDNRLTVEWSGKTYRPAEGDVATGYLKETLTGSAITPQASYTAVIRKEGNAPAWGAVYNQYYAPISEVTGQKGVLNVEKMLFVETNSGKERQIRPVTENQPLRVGDKVIVRLTVRTDRDMDYVVMKDLRCGAFEPAEQLSGSSYRDGVWFYRAPKDVSENFYFQHLPKGTFVIEYPAYVSRSGEYAGGITTIQCQYAPEFVSHTEGTTIRVTP